MNFNHLKVLISFSSLILYFRYYLAYLNYLNSSSCFFYIKNLLLLPQLNEINRDFLSCCLLPFIWLFFSLNKNYLLNINRFVDVGCWVLWLCRTKISFFTSLEWNFATSLANFLLACYRKILNFFLFYS